MSEDTTVQPPITVTRSEDSVELIPVIVDGEVRANIVVSSYLHTYPGAPGGPRSERVVDLTVSVGEEGDGDTWAL